MPSGIRRRSTLPDADIIPFGGPEPLGPSKAARLVGNTGPQPAPPAEPAASASRPAKRKIPVADATPPGDIAPNEVWTDVEIPAEVEGWMDFVRRRLSGAYRVDDFGFDPELTDKVLLALVRPLYNSWFRVETTGLENVPSDSGALIVANHSGVIALDSVMAQVALHDEHPAHRHLRMLGANLVFQTPFVGEVARKAGHTLACHPDAERLLAAGELVGVWPEGFKGVGKPFSQRYKLQRFGRGGFVAAALRTGAPIIPTAIVGAEEIYPMIGNAKTVARILGLPYFPVTPTFPWLGPLGMVPLPSKWLIHFGDPIPTDHFPEGAADDPMVVFNLTDQVREQIQQSLYRLLVRRPSAFG
jgi:1-acyl-sn-glycerol-3-phosphate acyltransferase